MTVRIRLHTNQCHVVVFAASTRASNSSLLFGLCSGKLQLLSNRSACRTLIIVCDF